MKAKKFSLYDYAQNHPAGDIGLRISVRVEDVMLRDNDLPICRENNFLSEVLVELSQKRSGCLLAVDDESRLLGIFTDGDLRRSLQKHGNEVLNKKMHELINIGATCIDKDALVWDAIKLMQKNSTKWITALPVTNGDKLIGLVRMHDIIQRGFLNAK